ncbi:MAG: proline--tRNA ligase [Patescibacteria group bacterium]
MLMSRVFAPTLREVPSEAETPSHKLLLRAGFIRKSAAGLYTYLPLGKRVLAKIERLVREEMDAAGGREVLMPILQPAQIWRQTGRWDVYGEEMFRLADRHGRDFCLGPTHEELITTLVANEIRSYRELPLLLYQIQNKYRDEIRPRFGVMRSREFIMKDLYSFDQDQDGLARSYEAMHRAYSRVFTRAGLDFRAVEADSGAIGGETNHEFMVLAGTGEASIIHCLACDYAANAERAEAADPEPEAPGRDGMELVHTPGLRTVAEVAAHLGVAESAMIKTMLYIGERGPFAVLLRGDDMVNEIKLGHALGEERFHPASEAEAAELGLVLGFLGPAGLTGVRLLADRRVMRLGEGIAGANRPDYHLRHVVPARDFQVEAAPSLRLARAGDICPRCGGEMSELRGVEVGHIFKLGTKYSEALGATFQDEAGLARPFVMGCYGIGISRTMAAAVEQHHDEQGIKWPVPIAPYEAVVIPVNLRDPGQAETAAELYHALCAAGVQAVLDDRDERPGVKFKDADLIGFPLRLTVGPRGLAAGVVEVRDRRNGRELSFALASAASDCAAFLAAEREKYDAPAHQERS